MECGKLLLQQRTRSETMGEMLGMRSLSTNSKAKYVVVGEQKVLSSRDIARFSRTSWPSKCQISSCCGLSTSAPTGEMAIRNCGCVWSHPSTSGRSLLNRVPRTGKDRFLRYATGRRRGSFTDYREDDNGFKLARKINGHAFAEKNPESLRILAVLSDETSPSAAGNYSREQAQKNLNEGHNVLHVENNRRVDSVEKDEHQIANIVHLDGREQIEDIGSSGSKKEEGDWWEKELIEEENILPSPSTSVNGTWDGVEEDSSRFKIRNGREVYGERTYLVGLDCKGAGKRSLFSIFDSLKELAQLADTAGLVVVGSTYQKLDTPNPKTYIGIGKVGEIQAAVRAFNVETIIFDDELSPGQLRNLEKAFEGEVRVCDRTALILDIFKQRAATREATLQVELAQFEYQLPRLTRMWSHLERQAGGMVKGMGEKQIEVDKRILRTRISALKEQLESVRDHRQQYRDRRAAVPIPVVSLVGYTNAGKSTFLNRLSGANVLAEDRLFATLDPTTRRVQLPNGKECLFTDTVGFIQKLPTQLVAAFRATLEEITDSSLLVHMVDISHPMAKQQVEAVNKVLAELDVHHIPLLTVWNKIDKAENPGQLIAEAAERENVICVSALTGEGIDSFYDAVQRNLKDLMVWVEAVVPYDQGDLISVIHRLGIVDKEEYMEQGTLIKAHVPLALSRKMIHLRQALTALKDDVFHLSLVSECLSDLEIRTSLSRRRVHISARTSLI